MYTCLFCAIIVIALYIFLLHLLAYLPEVKTLVSSHKNVLRYRYLYVIFYCHHFLRYSLISSLRFHTETLAYFKTLWFVSLYEITFHNGLLVNRHSCLKIIPTRLLRHVWSEVVMENHTHTSPVHGKSHTRFLINT